VLVNDLIVREFLDRFVLIRHVKGDERELRYPVGLPEELVFRAPRAVAENALSRASILKCLHKYITKQRDRQFAEFSVCPAETLHFYSLSDLTSIIKRATS